MKNKKELLAYCGLYCGDCAGYSGEIADTAQNLKETTEKYKFQQTAQHLFPKELQHYDKLREMIDFMTKLKCPKPCRERKAGEVKCKIWKCCRDKGFFVCYECDRLKAMSPLHGESCTRNLKAIKEMGVEKWLRKGKRFWFADDE
ncbi:MAG: DUF3795 domain-containing protein [bacterium]